MDWAVLCGATLACREISCAVDVGVLHRVGDRLRVAEFVGFDGWAGPVQRALGCW
jgi:hypothetical protein